LHPPWTPNLGLYDFPYNPYCMFVLLLKKAESLEVAYG
jgi:hypothetical protein